MPPCSSCCATPTVPSSCGPSPPGAVQPATPGTRGVAEATGQAACAFDDAVDAGCVAPGAWCLASDGITAIEAFVRSLRPDERAHRKPQGLSPSGAAGLPWRGPDVPVPFRCCLRVQERAVRHMAPGQPQSSWRVPRSVVPVGNSTTTSPTRCAPLRPVVFALPTPHREGVNVLLGGGTARQARSSSPGRSRLSDG